MTFLLLSAINSVPVSTLIKFLEAVGANPGAKRERLAQFAGYSDRQTQRALSGLQSLGLITVSSDDEVQPVEDRIGRGLSEDSGKLIIKEALLGFRPFELLCEGLALGEDKDTAIRKANAQLGLSPENKDEFGILIKWGLETEIFEREGSNTIQVAPELVVETEEDLGRVSAKDVESRARARLYIARRIGRAAFDFLEETERALLADSLMSFRTDADDCISDAGQALEDFLREIAIDQGHAQGAATCNGPSQVAQLLRKHNLILTNHLHRVSALSAMRATSTHSKAKTTAMPWTLDEHSAFWTIDGTLLLIRTVYTWVYEGRQIA